MCIIDPLSVMQRLAEGNFIMDLNAALIEVSEEVVQTGKDGTVTVTFRISSAVKGTPAVVMAETIVRRPPKVDPKGAVFYALDGELHSQDPRQTRLDFSVVGGEVELREARANGPAERRAE